jgi:hypothetical protein
VKRSWLDADQIEWLNTEGHATWNEEDGTVTGRHRKLFAELDPSERTTP